MAPPAGTPSLEECYELMEEMRRIYSSDEDALRMQELQAARKQISAACAAREAHMHELIKEMSRRVADAEAKATPPEPEDAHARRVMALEEAAANAAADHEQLTAEAEALSSEQQALASQRAAVVAARAESDAAAQARAAELQNHVALYPLLTQLRWDLAAPAGRVKGHVVDARAGDVRPFDLDAAALSPVQLSDRLWELI